MARFAAILFVVGSMLFAQTWAGVIPGRWEKVETIPNGLPIIVVLKAGDRVQGTFLQADDRSVQLENSRGIVVTLPKDAISRIRSREKFENDGLANGTIIGAIAGVGVSIVPLLIAVDDHATGAGLISMGFVTGTGVALGMGIDALIKAPAVFFEAAE